MGRRRQSHFDDPPRFHKKGKTWYHVTGTLPRVWIKLSTDRAEALRLWADLEGVKPDDSTKTFAVVARRYVREVYPAKALRTRKDNDQELAHLLPVFGQMPIDAILAQHIRRYMDLRGETAKVRANREKALFSHIFNKAREWGYTAATNPCQGVKGFRETGRDRYVTDEEFERVKACADEPLRHAMDVALLTGQRPADVLKVRRGDIHDGALWIVQNKTGARLAIALEGQLAGVIGQILASGPNRPDARLILNEAGQPLRADALRSRFDKARKRAGVQFQFRDLRAKAASDTGDLAHSQKLLAHKHREMTEHYVRAHKAERVAPLR